MPAYVTPGVYFEPATAERGLIPALRTDVAAFIGIAERGPMQQPTRISSLAQFQQVFGKFIPQGFLAYAVKAFFENGGRDCYVVRVAADAAETETNGAQPADHLSSFVTLSAGFAPGAVVTLNQTISTQTSTVVQPTDRISSFVVGTIGFVAHALVECKQKQIGLTTFLITFRRVKAVDATLSQLLWDDPLDVGYDLTQPIKFTVKHQVSHLLRGVSGNQLFWAQPLEEFFDLSQTIHCQTGAAEASGALPDETGQPTLTISAINAGSWGNDLAVRVTRSNAAATRTALQSQPVDRKSSFVESIAGFALGSLVRLFQAGTSTTDYRIVTGVNAQRNLLIWDVPLAAGFNLTTAADPANPSPLALESLEFGLSVYEAGQVCEVFTGLSLFATDNPRYVVKVINQSSRLIRVRDHFSATPRPRNLPDPRAVSLTHGALRLSGGRDGIAALQPHDFTGRQADDEKRGLRALEDIDEIALIAIPDALVKPTPPPQRQVPEKNAPNPCLPGEPSWPEVAPLAPPLVELAPEFTQERVFAVQQAMVQHCETQRDRLALLDPPLNSRSSTSLAQMGWPESVDVGEVQGWRQRFDSKYAALYSPWVLVVDPLPSGSRVVRAIPPSGHVAGIMARTDSEFGVHRAPANQALRWAQGFTDQIGPELQGLLNPQGINCLRALPGRGLHIYGARTVSSDPLWRYVNVRRLLMMIEEAIEQAIQWSVFEPNNLALRSLLIVAITGFLESLWQRGQLAGETVEQAFFVRCDETNNPPALADTGRLIIDVGVAPVYPAEFVIIRIGRTEDILNISEFSGTIRGDL